jgi:hypothetical protein
MYKIRLKNSAEKVAYIMDPGSFGTEMKFVADPFRLEVKMKNNGKIIINFRVWKSLPNPVRPIA